MSADPYKLPEEPIGESASHPSSGWRILNEGGMPLPEPEKKGGKRQESEKK